MKNFAVAASFWAKVSDGTQIVTERSVGLFVLTACSGESWVGVAFNGANGRQPHKSRAWRPETHHTHSFTGSQRISRLFRRVFLFLMTCKLCREFLRVL